METFPLISGGWSRSQLRTYGGRETVSKENENRIGRFARERTPAKACCCITLASPDLADVRNCLFCRKLAGRSVVTACCSFV